LANILLAANRFGRRAIIGGKRKWPQKIRENKFRNCCFFVHEIRERGKERQRAVLKGREIWASFFSWENRVNSKNVNQQDNNNGGFLMRIKEESVIRDPKKQLYRKEKILSWGTKRKIRTTMDQADFLFFSGILYLNAMIKKAH
jgi:hypothetical protein